MPEPPGMVPLYVAPDLRHRESVIATCDECGHSAEVPAAVLREKLSEFANWLGKQFRCQRCGYRGAAIDARRALGHFG